MLSICGYLSLSHSKWTPSQAFLALKYVIVSSNWNWKDKTRQSSTLHFVLSLFQKLNCLLYFFTRYYIVWDDSFLLFFSKKNPDLIKIFSVTHNTWNIFTKSKCELNTYKIWLNIYLKDNWIYIRSDLIHIRWDWIYRSWLNINKIRMNTYTVFPLISATPFGIHTEISASPLISAA